MTPGATALNTTFEPLAPSITDPRPRTVARPSPAAGRLIPANDSLDTRSRPLLFGAAAGLETWKVFDPLFGV
ncbi:hypothetical protein GCM10009559_42800 [Pseudonocardia zijingensis]|uniref:Uncharacterized protein n=1 Tax=Pseudonocardia zijingensis TaxID=153376 RepID=A0ABP4B758_9PSEU